jgi:hypothetical protein
MEKDKRLEDYVAKRDGWTYEVKRDRHVVRDEHGYLRAMNPDPAVALQILERQLWAMDGTGCCTTGNRGGR